ncbi:MAG: hypothetical protein KDA68_13065, partial [Planctomycetaceae bacterium]|nr:hypothetical protein [Planctomycetaceae bacterium]
MRLPNFAGSETSRLARSAGMLAVVGWVCLSVAGCRTLISVVDRNEAFKQAWDGPWTVKPERMTEETWTVLRYWDLDKDYLEDSPGTVREAKRLFRDLPDREWACALAELCYWEGDRLVAEAAKRGTNPPKQGRTTASAR